MELFEIIQVYPIAWLFRKAVQTTIKNGKNRNFLSDKKA